MIPIFFKVTHEGVGFSASEWRALLREAWRHAGVHWHQALMPKHFTVAAEKEYGYQSRDGAYTRRKARLFGHRKPLVFRGTLEAACRRVMDVRENARAGEGGVAVYLHGPRHLYGYHKNFDQPDKAAEIRAFSSGDKEAIYAVLDRRLDRAIERADRGGRIGAVA
ncbi:MAG: hypothetical protein IMZ66_08910 [Planctomycetes bacterium]|nr:hypothetical protein [Planctomycetota bacterium]